MTSPIRLRQHTDGRLAVFRDGMWLITSVPPATPYPSWFHDDRLCSGEGWSELLVAELPEPDGHESDQDNTPHWTPERFSFTLTSYPDEVLVTHVGNTYSAMGHYKTTEQLNELRADALKMLAAVAACERYRAQRETTT